MESIKDSIIRALQEARAKAGGRTQPMQRTPVRPILPPPQQMNAIQVLSGRPGLAELLQRIKLSHQNGLPDNRLGLPDHKLRTEIGEIVRARNAEQSNYVPDGPRSLRLDEPSEIREIVQKHFNGNQPSNRYQFRNPFEQRSGLVPINRDNNNGQNIEAGQNTEL